MYVAGPRVYFARGRRRHHARAGASSPRRRSKRPAGSCCWSGTLALGRFALATAALDTGSPFGGMGASRDMTIAALAEPALMLGLFTSALAGRIAQPRRAGAARRCSAGRRSTRATCWPSPALFIVVIAETGRIPVDNPATHLELTMIHEAMVLEYAGPDLALVEWASAVKELLFMTLLVDLFLPVGIATSLAPAALGGGGLAAWAARCSCSRSR